jgi:Protein of unknown function (DUF3047)
MRFFHLMPAVAHRTAAVLMVALVLGACATVQPMDDEQLNLSAWAQSHALPHSPHQARWRHQVVGNRRASVYEPVHHAGRPALRADSDRSDSLLRIPLSLDGPPVGRLRFSWYLEQHNEHADIGDAARDDATVRLILQFDGDRSEFSARDHRLSEMMQLVTGEPLPYATLMYVWDPVRPVGTVLTHPRSERIKLMVAQSGSEQLGTWVNLDRDVAADHQAAFGRPPVRLKGMALMTDSNNTGQRSRAWYGPLQWVGAR